jgi:predicted PurR-regulated permease PerM
MDRQRIDAFMRFFNALFPAMKDRPPGTFVFPLAFSASPLQRDGGAGRSVLGRPAAPPASRPVYAESRPSMPLRTAELFKLAAIIVAVALVPVLVWLLFGVFLMAMGAILIAVLLNLGAEPLTRYLRFPHGAALFTSGAAIASFLGIAIYYMAGIEADQLQDVLQRARQAVDAIRANLQGSEIGWLVLSHIQGDTFTLSGLASGVFGISFGFISTVVISLFGGIYLAAQAHVYRDGLIQLLPHRMRENGAETLQDIANALRLWMLGQLIGMVLIGLLTAIATSLIGLPSPFALGLIAGLLEFIPYVGPILGAVPGILVAMTQGLDTVLWTVAAYALIQQVEGHLIAPLISREMVYIPPLVLILGIVAITTLFGRFAAIFAAPIAVIIFVAVKKLYVRDSLGDQTPIPGETARHHHASAPVRHF